MAEPRKLTKKQMRFCQEYARWCNAAKAARLAGYSEHTAGQKGWSLLNEPKYAHVAEYVDQLLNDQAAQRQMDHDLLRQRLRSRLVIDMRDYFREDGTCKPPSELTQEQAQHVQSFAVNRYHNESKDGALQEGENINLRWTSATKAEDMLARHSGFYTEGDKAIDDLSDYLQAAEALEGRLAALSPEALEQERKINQLAAAFQEAQEASKRNEEV